MEPSELESTGSSTNKDPQLSECEPSSHVPHHDHDRQPSDSDLNDKLSLKDGNETLELGGEFHEKLDLEDEGEGGGETVKKGSDFEAAGGGQLSGEAESVGGEAGALEPSEGKGNEDDGWNYDEGSGWNETVKESLIDKVSGDDNADDGWNCDDGDGWNAKGSEMDKVSGDGDGDGDVDDDDGVEGQEGEKKEGRSSGRVPYPLRPDAEDCAFYLKTGSCKFGLNCKFNHPVKRKKQAANEKVGGREESAERSGQIECKYYLRSGGCKFGNACKFNHTRVKPSAAPLLELNFLGLPIRLGERECPYYMRTGSCKFGANCKFNHPDPSSGGGSESPSGFGNGSSLQGITSWSSSRTLNETAPFVPMILSPTRAASPRSSDWNGYQAPPYLSERNMHPPSAYALNNPAIETNNYMHHQKPMPVEEFPERPGEPECSYYLKTGDCKFRSNCKFHHPKNRTARLPPCNLSDKGLPLRPDQNVCTHYSRYGICKFGPACKFDHPPQPSTIPDADQQSTYTNSPSDEVAGMGVSATDDNAAIQQPL